MYGSKLARSDDLPTQMSYVTEAMFKVSLRNYPRCIQQRELFMLWAELRDTPMNLDVWRNMVHFTPYELPEDLPPNDLLNLQI